MAIARWSPITMFLTSLFIAWFWLEGSATAIGQSGHAISAGILITACCFCIGQIFIIEKNVTKSFTASYVLTSQDSPRSMGGHFIGISEDGMPLYTHGEAFLQKTSRFCSFSRLQKKIAFKVHYFVFAAKPLMKFWLTKTRDEFFGSFAQIWHFVASNSSMDF
jgi:hypothetical protein